MFWSIFYELSVLKIETYLCIDMKVKNSLYKKMYFLFYFILIYVIRIISTFKNSCKSSKRTNLIKKN